MPTDDISAPGTEIAVTKDAPPSMLALIARAASDPAVDVAKMQALLDMQERLMAGDARREFNEAFARLLPQLPRVTRRGEVKYPEEKNNPRGPLKTAFKYAKWEDIDEAIRPLLIAEGFSLSFNTVPQQGAGVIVTGTLRHRAGHTETASIGPLPLDTSGGKNNLQGAGSTFSYGKRYTATMLLNLTFEGEDDDGMKGGQQFIDAESVKRLNDLIVETKADFPGFLRFMEVAGLPEIEVKDYPTGVNILLEKRRRLRENS